MLWTAATQCGLAGLLLSPPWRPVMRMLMMRLLLIYVALYMVLTSRWWSSVKWGRVDRMLRTLNLAWASVMGRLVT